MSTSAKNTGFYFDEKSFWHGGGDFALTFPVGGLVQPLVAGGLPEAPETKRRFKNLMDVTGLSEELTLSSARACTDEELALVHPVDFLSKFKELSDAGGGNLGLRTPFLKGGYELAALSAGLSRAALSDVLTGKLQNAYALSRPPGHHCLPEWPNGFCLLANVAIAIEAAKAAGEAKRFAVIDWDVHHGNGTEHIFYKRDDVLTISIHEENNYPVDTGALADKGKGVGLGYNMNIPLPPGSGHNTYLEAMDKLVVPAFERFKPDVIIVACGYDAGTYDPLGHQLCTVETFRQMTRRVREAAERLCDGKLMMAHEGGYSEVYVPFCGHAVMEEMSGSSTRAPDPMAEVVAARQPNARVEAFFSSLIDEMALEHFG
ncbi:class II histone deacetylase [Lentibacter sp. XHP0401]|uniref:class II histone deacetylase n=1 Tax=Lentibacter sp. XHP0401 TaxID=2984334 RepID=UPI0021E922A4|nr:class II histone deacetylase [Lentibacter sp. XHP0401]MCV2894111.1 class II histone deacetylase [Lentibacter sp. XHP0401]